MLITDTKQLTAACQASIFTLIPIPNELEPTWLLMLHMSGS